jgi:hypothetical protein
LDDKIFSGAVSNAEIMTLAVRNKIYLLGPGPLAKFINAAVLAQSLWRGKVARAQLRKKKLFVTNRLLEYRPPKTEVGAFLC